MDQLQVHHEVFQALKQSFNDDSRLNKLLNCLTLPPMFTTFRFDTSRVECEPALKALSSCLAKQCEELQREKYDVFLHPSLPDCIIIKNRGPHSLVKQNKEVIVDLACGMAVLRGAHVYKQGIMGAPHSLRAEDIISVYADLDGKCLKGLMTVYGGMKLFVGNGIAQVSRTDLLMQIVMKDPQKGELILDMCAAPGGKTAHIAAVMNNQGRVVALEKSKERTRKMEHLKSECIEVYTFDSVNAAVDHADSDCGPPFPPAIFDRILVDAPCSALGQRPCYVNKISVNQLKSFPVIQHKLLLTAVQLLKPGGVLVYSTCTITREENEDQVSKLLAKCPCIELVSTPFKLGGDGLQGSNLTEEQRSMVQRFDPTSTKLKDIYNVDTIGFFIAKFVKK